MRPWKEQIMHTDDPIPPMGAIPPSWQTVLAPVLATPQSHALGALLREEERAGVVIYPPRGQRLAALALTPLDAVRVVIIGQDPYHNPGQAHGLAFSVPDGVRPPPSLANIYKELHADIGLPIPAHGNLTRWAQQGVLLLNNALTVRENQPGSHQKIGWEPITDALLAAAAARSAPCVFMLWGSHAQKKAARVAGLADAGHLILEATHPSPLSAYKGFLGCRHFSRANRFLTEQGRGAIDWNPG